MVKTKTQKELDREEQKLNIEYMRGRVLEMRADRKLGRLVGRRKGFERFIT